MSVTDTKIPQELRDLAQWVVFRIQPNPDGKPTKKPYQARSTRSNASSTSRATWATFEQAEDALDRDPSLHGVGFVFSDTDDYVGIDLDHCIKNGRINDAAKAILDSLNSYSEYSPSGDGIHVIVRGALKAGRKTGAIEMYDRGRYFTMTGNHIPGTPSEIYERQEALDELWEAYFGDDEDEAPPPPPRANNVLTSTSDHELLNTAFGFKNGDELRRLYQDGDTSRHAGDDSAADLALCNHLAFLTGRDPVRMDALFRQSALYRKKWDEKRGDLTYGQRTIQQAIKNCKEVYTPGGGMVAHGGIVFGDEVGRADLSETLPERRVFIGEVMKKGMPQTPWLIDSVLVKGRIHLFYGEPESGKTILCLSYIRFCIERGIPVLFVDEESGAGVIARLLIAMGVDADLVDKYVHYLPFPGIDRRQHAELLAYANAIRPGLIMFDSLTDMLSVAGLDENSGNEVTLWMLEVAQALARSEYQPAVILVDHVTKDTANVKYSVASRAKKAKSDVLWYIEKQAEFDETKTARVDLIRHKNRPGVLPKRVSYTVGGAEGLLVCRPFNVDQDGASTLSEGAQQMLDALKDNGGEMSPGHVARLFGKDRKTVWKWASELKEHGLIAKDGSTSDALYKLGDSPSQLEESPSPNLGNNLGNLPPSIGASPQVIPEGRKQRNRDWMEKFD